MDLAAAPSDPETDRSPTLDHYHANRARLLDIAAFLDRADRADETTTTDFRMYAFRNAIQALLNERSDRARAVQLILSDPNPEPEEEVR